MFLGALKLRRVRLVHRSGAFDPPERGTKREMNRNVRAHPASDARGA